MQLKQSNTPMLEPLAIIGIGCRFPGNISNLEELWTLLYNKTDAISDYPASRIKNVQQLVDKERGKNKIITQRGGYLNEVEYFDPAFFNISPLEAEKIDPAQRILLEVTQEAIENAGLIDTNLQNSNTGVFVGNWTNDYEHRLKKANQDIDVYATTGTGRYALSGRLSYVFNLQGPSLTVDTACSSSIVALNIASQSLQTGECDMAFVGASNVISDFFVSIGYSRSGLLSEYGECRFGDEKSTGYVRSEGAAMVILKRLSDAQRDGNHIHAVVLSTACNSDGQSHKNLFAPSAITQEVMIRKAIQKSKINPKDIVYIEAHGTGTKAGDPTEIKSIWNALSDDRDKDDIVYTGSIKTNFGHTEAVAGLAGLLKVILSLQHKTILPSLHFDNPNPKIDWDKIGIIIPKEQLPWPSDKPLIAGVNTFGITGTNAHAIIGVAPESLEKKNEVRKDIFILPISAKNEESLLLLANKYLAFIKKSPKLLQDICAMAALHRTHHNHKEVFIAKSKEELVDKLEDFIENNSYTSKKTIETEDIVKTVFIFPGQGAQWQQMGKALYKNEIVYKTALDEINSIYKQYVDWDLIEEIDKEEQTSLLNEIDKVQPILVAVEIALANLWMSKGVIPDIVVGHSMGEVAAAYVAGNITLGEAAQIIITRSRLMKTISGKGEMGITDLTIEEAQKLLIGKEEDLSIAVMNSKNSTVLSGNPEALNQIFSILEAQGRFNRKIKVDVASHSPQMDSIKEELEDALQQIQPKNSSIQFYSTVFNKLIEGKDLDATYWKNNLRNPVQFGAVIQQLVQQNNIVFIEMSPHPTLIHAIQENTEECSNKVISVASFLREKDEQIAFYTNFTELFCANIPFNWKNIYPERGEFIELPTYAWQKERYWIDVEEAENVSESSELKPINLSQNLYCLKWQNVSVESSVFKPKRILIIKDIYGFYSTIEQALIEQGHIVQTIENTDNLVGIEADIVLHLRSLYKDETYNYYYDCGVSSIQKIIKYFTDKNIKILVITNGANVILEDNKTNLNASLLNGLLRTIQNEYLNISIHQIDISNEINLTEIKNIPSLLFINEEYRELAIRNQQVLTPIITKTIVAKQTKTIQQDAMYIVTGGNNGLGFETVKWLVQNNAKHIAIISRSGFSENVQKEINNLQNTGVNIYSYLGDVSNKENIDEIITTIQLKHPAIKGVFHAAGILDDTLFENLTQQKFEHTLAAKANGAWNLHQYFPENTLDFFVVFSSVMGILGSAGQSNYAAANTFLDTLIAFRRNNNMAGTAVNWGTIAEIGLAAQQENRGDRLLDYGLKPIAPALLKEYFSQLFLSEEAVVMAMDIDFQKWANNHPKDSQNFMYNQVLPKLQLTEENKMAVFASVLEATKYAKQQIKQTIATITKMNPAKIKDDDTFKSYGVDSLLALQIKNKLQKDLEINLNVSVIWSYPTVNKLADFIATQLKLEELDTESISNINSSKELIHDSKEDTKTIEQEVQEMSLEELLKQLNDKVGN